MTAGLSVNDVVNVQVNLTPIAAAVRNFGNLMLVGSTPNVIDTAQRFRFYTTLQAVGNDFGVTSPEYLSATLFFAQSPQPAGLYIGYWAQGATSGILHGGLLSATQQLIANFTAVASGGFKITVDGVLKTLSAMNFSAVTTLPGVAAIVQTALAGSATCVWNAVYNRFDITSTTTGPGAKATGTITFGGQTANNDTVTIAGTAVTFVSGTPSGNQVQIGASQAATQAALLAFLQASTDVNLITCTYSSAGSVITVTAAAVGTAGNAITLAKSSTNLTVSGATLSGGVATSAVSFAQAPVSGTDVSLLMNLTAATGALTPVNGIAAESAISCINTLASMSNDWYGLYVCASQKITSDDLAISAFIEGASPSRIYGITSQDSTILNAGTTTDIASQLQALQYKRTFLQYSSSSAYAAMSIFGRTFTVDFTGSNTALTVKFKTEPGVAAETITETQAAAATAKNCNIFVNYVNGTAIIQQGVMVGGQFFDVIHGTDWLQNDVQTALYNVLYQSTTKIPQTDAGIGILQATCDSRCAQAVKNGLLAPGQWNAPGFGALNQGDYLTKGFYCYAPPVASQSPSARSARQAPTIQIAAKLAGAVHFANVTINVNN